MTALQEGAPKSVIVRLPVDFAQSYANHGAAALVKAVKESVGSG